MAERRRLTPTRVGLGVLILAMVGMWIYVLLPSSAQAPANQLSSPTFGKEAEPICKIAVDRINALPHQKPATSPQQRGALVAQANGYLAQMLGGLASVAPSVGNDGHATKLWLGDWGKYLNDRKTWASELAAGRDTPFLESMVSGQPISLGIDDFAAANNMPDCATPYDV